MPALGLLTGTQERTFGGLPTLPLVNLYAEKAITEPTQFMLRSRPRLYGPATQTVPGSITRAKVSTDGFGTISVYGGDIYVDSIDKGNIQTNTPVSIAFNEIGVVIAADDDAYFWDGTTLRMVNFPDSQTVAKVAQHQGRFLFIPSSTNRYYWTEPLSNMLDGSGDIIVDSLDYASAESDSDKLYDMLIYKDMLILGGERTIEIHTVTGDDNLPWSRLLGATIDKGILATGCMARWNNGFAWISPGKAVYYSTGSGYEKISDDGIEQALREFDDPILDSFSYQGHEFLRIRPMEAQSPVSYDDLPNILIDAQTGQWSKWSTGGGRFLGGPVWENTTPGYFGSTEDGGYVYFGGTITAEDIPEHDFRAGIAIDGGAATIHNVLLRCQTFSSGSATISMRFSRDKGTTWSSWVPVNLYNAGNIRNKIEWRSLGMADSPGILFDFKTANAEEFSVSGAFYNESVQGRSR